MKSFRLPWQYHMLYKKKQGYASQSLTSNLYEMLEVVQNPDQTVARHQ